MEAMLVKDFFSWLVLRRARMKSTRTEIQVVPTSHSRLAAGARGHPPSLLASMAAMWQLDSCLSRLLHFALDMISR